MIRVSGHTIPASHKGHTCTAILCNSLGFADLLSFQFEGTIAGGSVTSPVPPCFEGSLAGFDMGHTFGIGELYGILLLLMFPETFGFHNGFANRDNVPKFQSGLVGTLGGAILALIHIVHDVEFSGFAVVNFGSHV